MIQSEDDRKLVEMSLETITRGWDAQPPPQTPPPSGNVFITYLTLIMLQGRKMRGLVFGPHGLLSHRYNITT